MLTREQEEKLHIARIIAIISAYEFVAIVSGKVPTVSRISWTINKKWWGKIALWTVLGWLTEHLLVPPTEDRLLVGEL